MGNATFPTVPGMTLNVTKSPTWSTAVQQAVSGKEIRRAQRSRTIWKFTLNFEFLRADSRFTEYQQIAAFFNARQGQYDSFLFSDPSDNTATAQAFGSGDGVTTKFKLLHSIGSWSEPIGYASSPTIYINGVSTTAFTSDGLTITFNTAPAAGAALTWSGTFCYRVRFAEDTIDFEQFMQNLWTLNKCNLVGVI
jgi:uncharacterized protein (TIGR02217 family)